MNTSIFGQIDDPANDAPRGRPDGLDEDASELEPGTSIQGKYTVLGVLGHGGFAVVYDAKHDGLGRAVAIKVLHLRPDTPLALIERFRREARISALIHHHNVLEVYDTGALADGSPYLVMERVQGENLSKLIQRGPLSIASAVEMARQLLHGLSALEEQGIVHRDIKPDNLMLHDSGDGMPTVKLVDFGIAKRVTVEPQPRLTCHGALVGTPQYMSPEQIRGEDVDNRTDVYATGAVLYEMLTGHPPHESTSFSELVVSVLGGQVTPLRERRANCPAELERIALKALAHLHAQRFGSPRLMLDSLDKFVRDFALPSGPDAFRATDRASHLMTPVHGPFFSVRKLGKLGKPAQLGLLVLLLSTPGQVKHVHGATPLGGVEATTVTTFNLSSGAPVDAMVHRIAPASARAPEQRAHKKMGAPAPADSHASAARQVSKAELHSAEATLGGPVPAVQTALEPAATTEPEQSALGREPRQPSQPREPGIPSRTAHPQPSTPDPRPAQAALDPAQRQQLDATLQTALAAMVRGRLDAAKAGYTAAVKLAPGEPAAYRGLGLVAARLGAHHEARVALNKYLALAPRAPDAAAIRKRLTDLP